MAIAVAGNTVGFVHDDNIPPAGPRNREHLGLLDEVDRGDRDRYRLPGVDPHRQAAGQPPQGAGVENGRIKAEAVEQFARPLIAQTCGGDDQDAVGCACRPELRHDESCLNGLAEPHLVCKQHPGSKTAEQCQGRLQLMGEQIDSCLPCAPERAWRRVRRDERATGAPP